MGQFDHLPTLGEQGRCAKPKPSKFASRLEREAGKQEVRDKEDRNKTAARKRDGWMCRFPRCVCHSLRLHPEVAHLVAKGMGGDHGHRSHVSNLMCLCPARHQDSRISLHANTLRIEPLTHHGTNGPVMWMLDLTAVFKGAHQRRSGDEQWVVLAVEEAPRVLAPLTHQQGIWLEQIAELAA